MSGSETGVSYQLRRDGTNVGTTIAGTGAALNFPNQFTGGAYSVRATNGFGCTIIFGEAVINVRPTPRPVLTVTDNLRDPILCQTGTATITVSPAGGRFTGDADIIYTGGTTALAFGVIPGLHRSVYTITADGCSGATAIIVTVTATPPMEFALTGGTFCEGSAGVPIQMSGSQVAINYQLQRSGVNVGTPIAGTGAPISFPNQTVAGTYSVRALRFGTSDPSTFPLPLVHV